MSEVQKEFTVSDNRYTGGCVAPLNGSLLTVHAGPVATPALFLKPLHCTMSGFFAPVAPRGLLTITVTGKRAAANTLVTDCKSCGEPHKMLTKRHVNKATPRLSLIARCGYHCKMGQYENKGFIGIHSTCPCGHTTVVGDDGSDMHKREIRCERDGCGIKLGQRRVRGWCLPKEVNPLSAAHGGGKGVADW